MNALGKTVVVVGTILAIGALTRHPVTPSGVVADPPLLRERESVLHTPAYDQDVDRSASGRSAEQRWRR